jgi:hypothetical protein
MTAGLLAAAHFVWKSRAFPLVLKQRGRSVDKSVGRRHSRARVKHLELWQWRYRSPATGRMCKTSLPITADEAARYPDAQPIAGTMLSIERDEEEFDETAPDVYLNGSE